MTFALNEENRKLAEKELKKYPENRKSSAVKSLLHLAQKQHGWISQDIIEYVATFLDMPSIRVHEVATFYTMFHLKPVGTYHIKFCGTTPCMLCGCEDVMNISLEHLSLSLGEVSKDGLFSTEEVECLGACANGPVVMINDDFYEDLNAERLIHIIEQLKKGHTPKKGSSIGRHASEPFTLKEQEDDSSSINHKGEKS